MVVVVVVVVDVVVGQSVDVVSSSHTAMNPFPVTEPSVENFTVKFVPLQLVYGPGIESPHILSLKYP